MDWSRAHRTPIQMRYSDTDMMGHINNAAYVQFLEFARMDLLAALLPTGTHLPVVLARLELDYRREVHLHQTVEVLTLPVRVGNSSWEYAFRLLADGEVSAEGRSVQVHTDPVTRRGSPLPDEVRSKLVALLPEATHV
ncbi:acyl-CoA thioesterase [Deinococcus aquiradiocola]|uniref:Thioesterase n=1 Tax=Deinococcus aquiradiocola TaxID=393059 RepID=A0A917USW6_9DEIO|nr:thioesterase family protein [Deinococcus aquiradiocola]GGJ83525.1 thioesterase [Deinococcus aquiradiocola]